MTATYTSGDLEDLMQKFGLDMIDNTINVEAPLLKELKARQKLEPSAIGVIQCYTGLFNSFAAVADGGTLPNGDAKNGIQGRYDPVFYTQTMSIGAMRTKLLAGGGVVDDLEMQFRTMGETAAFSMERALLDPILGTTTTSATTSDDDFKIGKDSSGLKEGMKVDVYRSTTLITSFTIESITDLDGIEGDDITITATANFAAAINVGDVLYLAGTGPSGSSVGDRVMVNLELLLGTGAVYGLDPATDGRCAKFVGVPISAGSTLLNIAQMKQMQAALRKRSISFKNLKIFASYEQMARYQSLLLAQKMNTSEGKLDAIGNGELSFSGIQFYGGAEGMANMPVDRLYFVDVSQLELHCFVPPEFRANGNNSPNGGQSILMTPSGSGATLSYEAQWVAGYNLRCQRRQKLGGKLTSLAFNGVV